MAKTWNPGAIRETVGAFLEGWCRLDKGSWSSQLDLFEAYTYFCRMTKKKDLTLGEFNDEMEQRGFSGGASNGQPVWKGVALSFRSDVLVHPSSGVRYRGR
ncbi:MAG: hypothetical protein IIC64_13150 [SAR324 cluster bacterium]|nr:hypothetical protein [SAR324 cluster bacterium]